MSQPLPRPHSRHHASFCFHTTRWSHVCLAQADSEEGKRALADLCDAYYEPVVAWLRCELRNVDGARETSHAFFAQLLGGHTPLTADRQRGRFRSYLLGTVKHFLSHRREAAQSVKRGGGVAWASLEDGEARAVADEAQLSPDAAFDRQWALTLLGHTLEALRQECSAADRAVEFEKLQPWLTGDADHGDQGALAVELGMNLNSLKSQIRRLRSRFRVLLKIQIAATLNEGGSVEEEMALLFAALRQG